MSPFANILHDLRIRFGIRQHALAEMLGYEQSYVSALEVGTKGPPTPEFVHKLIAALSLDESEAHRVREAVNASQRKVEIPNDAPQSIFLMCHELRKQIDHLHPTQVEAILAVLRMSSCMKEQEPARVSRLRRRRSTSAQEVAM